MTRTDTESGLPADVTASGEARRFVESASARDRSTEFWRRCAIAALALAAHAAVLLAIAWAERANPPADAGGAVEIPVELATPEEAGGGEKAPSAQSAPPAAQSAPPAAQAAPQADARQGDGQPQKSTPQGESRPQRGQIVERPRETGLEQAARTRSDDSKDQQRKEEAAKPFGGLAPVAEAPKIEPTPTFLSPQNFVDPNRPQPAKDATNDNYRAMVLGKVAQAMIEPERPRPKALAIVGFTLDDSGALVAVWLARPSGSAELDAEATDMVRRAAPYPAPPAKADRNFAAAIAFGGE